MHYEAYWERHLEPAQSLLLKFADLRSGERVLDVACGTGLVTLRAAQAVAAAGEVIGTDLSSAMVTATREAALRAELPNVTAEQADAEALPFPKASFGVVLCALGLMYVPNSIQALCEMHRVLQPGGRVAVAVWGDANVAAGQSFSPLWTAASVQMYVRCFSVLGGRERSGMRSAKLNSKWLR